MKITITKKQEIIDDASQEPVFFVELSRSFVATWRNPEIQHISLYESELWALVKAIEKKLEQPLIK
ncbi:MAG: hypothetical protein WAV09_04365 [Minisyncoccia bacterium]